MCWPPGPEQDVKASVVLEVGGDGLMADDCEALHQAVESLPEGTVPLIDAHPDAEWNDVVSTIDAFHEAEIIEVLFASPAADGALKPGIRLIEDPTGHSALERIIRAAGD